MERCPLCETPFPSGRMEDWCLACLMGSAAGSAALPGLRILKEIARGGMAIVSKAEQARPRRIVAIKTLQTQWAANEVLCERFRREAHVLAALEHPGILPVYEVGEWEGLPWFTMKWAEQGSLATHTADFTGQWKAIARLIARIADALGFAHERGVLHRDVKPGNILFDAARCPYLADFGMAKQFESVVDQASLTLDAGVLGTPVYLAPELASGAVSEATTGSDIYSLAAVLYELIAGRPPYADAHLPSLLQRIAHESPVPVNQLAPATPRDLRLICEKAMSREPSLRYATAREMGKDLGRFVDGMPVLARPAGALESARFWCRRHPAMAALLSLVAGLIVTFLTGMAIALVQIRRSNADAIQARELAEMHLLESRLAEAEGIRLARQPNFRERVLRLVKAVGRTNESSEMRFNRRCEAVAALAYPKLGMSPVALADYAIGPASPPMEKPVPATATSPAGTWQAFTADNGAVQVRDAKRNTMLHVLEGFANHASHLAFSPDERFLLTLSEAQRLTIYDLVSGLPVLRYPAKPVAPERPVTWQGREIAPLMYEGTPRRIEITPGAYTCSRVPHFTPFSSDFCLSPQAGCLVAAGRPQGTQWNLTTSGMPGSFQAEGVTALTFSTDGLTLFAAGSGGLHRWDVDRHRIIPQSRQELLPPFRVPVTALSVAGGLAAIAGPEGVELWQLAGRTRTLAQSSPAFSVALNPDGKSLIVGRSQYEVWDCGSAKKIADLPTRPISQTESCITYSADGRWLVTGHDFARMALWRTRKWQKINTFESPSLEAVGHFVFSPDSSQLSTVSRNGILETWDLKLLQEGLISLDLGWD